MQHGRLIGIITAMWILPHCLSAQTLRSDTVAAKWIYIVDDTTRIADANYLFPPFIRDQIALKRYIRDPRFLQLRRSFSDTLAVDAIFLEALDIADGNIGHALFIATLATFDHYRLGIKIPLLGVLSLPLTTESESLFTIRRTHLPRRVLRDNIGRRRNDKDKLQHFFGSAVIAYASNSPFLTKAIGDLMEIGEASFVVGGDNDERDKMANKLGEEFGLRLLHGEDVLPSDILWGGTMPTPHPK